jgi:squalene-hopene/tetraprenyl-beta-curcumene cyclase
MRLKCVLALIAAIPAIAADWDPRMAAQYLDARQQAWAEWPRAKATAGTCMSCHTGVTYLLARPALRRLSGEAKPTSHEAALVSALRTRVDSMDGKDMYPSFTKEPLTTHARAVESVFAALFLTLDSGKGSLSAEARKAFDRLWQLQLKDGPARGAWDWFSLGLDPYEMPQSGFFGATMAAAAVAAAPADYRKQPEVREHVAELAGYFARETASQPLHNRLLLVWSAKNLPELCSPEARRQIQEEALRVQNSEGGWTIAALGPWKEHAAAPPASGSDAYATALAAMTLLGSGMPKSNPALTKALGWLAAHQDREHGFWDAASMNKKYAPDSMPAGFMRDAATAFASIALAGAGQ